MGALLSKVEVNGLRRSNGADPPRHQQFHADLLMAPEILPG